MSFMYKIKPLKQLSKVISVVPDKSISHRALMFSSIAKGTTVVKPFLISKDTLATLNVIKKIGVKIKLKGQTLTVKGKGLYYPRKSAVVLDANESGTTMRVLSGILAGQKFPVKFVCARSLAKRPMGRIVFPLRRMGASISGKKLKSNIYPPLSFKPVKLLRAGSFILKIASAQVKSAILLAGLYADKPTCVKEPFVSRDHTERMLNVFGCKIETLNKTIKIHPVKQLKAPKTIIIPGDFSSAAFFIVLGIITKNCRLIIKDVNLNPTRCGLLKILKRMGAKIKLKYKKAGIEPIGDIEVTSSLLWATKVMAYEIPSMIDEIPILAVAAAFAKGKTVVQGINELRVKETDRVASICKNLKIAKVDIKSSNLNGGQIVINGGSNYKQGKFKSYNDHRTAMSLIVFAAGCQGLSSIDNVKCIDKSFPEFISLFESLYE